MSDEPQPQSGISTFHFVLVARYFEGKLVTRLIEPETAEAMQEQLQTAEPALRATTVLMPVTVSIDEAEILKRVTSEFEARIADCLPGVFQWMRETN